jgi:hypothetical protein
MIPAKLYITLMVVAGSAAALVGLVKGNSQDLVIGLLCLGLGGFVYFVRQPRK